MLAARCVCPVPQVFSDDPETCHTCGRPPVVRVRASTWRIAVAVAEVALGYRAAGAARTTEGEGPDDLPGHSALR